MRNQDPNVHKNGVIVLFKTQVRITAHAAKMRHVSSKSHSPFFHGPGTTKMHEHVRLGAPRADSALRIIIWPAPYTCVGLYIHQYIYIYSYIHMYLYMCFHVFCVFRYVAAAFVMVKTYTPSRRKKSVNARAIGKAKARQ